MAAIAVAGIGIVGSKAAKHSTQITINAHPSDVFDWLVESHKIREWAPEIKVVASFESEDQEESVRTVQGENEGAREFSFTDKVLRYDYGEMISVRSTSRDVVQTQVFQLDSNDLGGTNLEFRFTRSPTGLGRFLMPFRGDESAKAMKRQMRKLKKLVEKQEGMVLAVDNESTTQTTVSNPPEVSGGGDEEDVKSEDDAPPAGTATMVPMKEVDVEANRKRNFRSLFGTG